MYDGERATITVVASIALQGMRFKYTLVTLVLDLSCKST